MDKLTLLRFIDDPTSLNGANALAVEGELGGSINESINRAIDVAVQAAVVNTINEGVRKGHWAFKEEQKILPALLEKVIIKEEVKEVKEETTK
jgi:hypothetical protein